MAVRPTSSQRILLVFASAAFFVANAFAQDNGEFDHRAHAVPGPDQTVYDLNDDGAATVTLDGVGSHSHYFNAGPPVQSGEIVSYEWAITATGETICNKVLCSHEFDVGETQVSLTVVDNTGDIAVDIVIVTVLPFSAATESPRIDSLSPNQGQNTGNNIVTVTGAFLYDDSRVYFGKQEALSVTRESLDKLTCIAPGGSGIVSVTVVSAVGTSNGAQYTFQSSSSIPVNFKFSTWMEKEGDKEFVVEEITSIVVGRDHRYYLGSLTGYVTVATVDRDRRVQDSCQGAFMGKARSITGLGFNPVDPFNRVFATTVTHFHIKKGVRWDNALVETVEVAANGCPVRGKTIISGLPVSNHDHGPSAITFLRDGRLLLSVGSFTNAGVSTPGDGIGGVPENPLSASYVVADYLRPGFNGAIVYDQYTNPATANIVSGDVKTYVDGIRNSFGVVSHSNGQLYATDNGPNNNFGKTSTSCTEQDNDPTTDDKLLRLVEGSFYGHPNRNRGRRDPRQCVFKGPEEAAGDDYVPPLGYMTSSTNGIIEYRANTFGGVLKGNLFMGKVAFGANGLTFRAELSDDGTSLKAAPYAFHEESGLSMTMGLYGEIVMPQLKKYRVIALRPHETGATSVEVIYVHPPQGPASGGNQLLVTGHFLNQPDVVVMVGGNACTNIKDMTYQHLKCTAPPGSGKVSVVVSSRGKASPSRGHEYEYL